MPAWSEFAAQFNLRDLLLVLATVMVIVIWREEKRIFRRVKNGSKKDQD